MDGSALYDPASLSTEPESPETKGDSLLDLEPATAAKRLVKLWTGLDPFMRHRLACAEVNALRREGYTNVRVVRRQDQAAYTVYPPPDRRAQPSVHAFNKARQLCRTFVGNLMADPPAALVEPTSMEDNDEDASEITQRAIDDIQSPQRLDTAGQIRRALDRACTYGSGFVRYYVDPATGGRVERTIQASPLATHADAPLIDPATGEPWGAIAMQPDPMTGQPMPVRQMPPEPRERFVTASGALTDDRSQAALDWKPGLCSEILDMRHVRFLPWGADRRNAECVLVATFITKREATRLLTAYEVTVTEEEEKKLTAYRPEQADYLLPEGRDGHRDSSREGDEALVFCLTGIWQQCPEYPDGAYLTALGDGTLLYRDTWVADVKGRRVALPLPVAQVPIWRNGTDNPYAEGLMDDLGGANEIRAAQVGHLMSYLDFWNNAPALIPTTSTVTERDWLTKRVIRILPGGEPKSIKGPGYEQASMELFGMTGTEMDGASHLQQAAQGIEDPSVTSGRHAFQILSQVHAQLSEPKQHVEWGYLTATEIELALTRAFNLDGETRWQGEDGAYKYRRWQGADLTGDIRLKPGTMTMLAPGPKAELTERWMASGAIDPETGKDMLARQISQTLGRFDDPFLMEIHRSIAKWEQGMPEGYQPPQPLPGRQQVMGPSGPMIQAVMVPQPDPVAQGVFPAKPHHSLPGVAQKRLDALAKLMASVKYDRQPDPWKAVVATEYQRMVGLAAPRPPMQPGQAQPQAVGEQRPNPAEPASPMNPTLDPQPQAA
jgi:hypothetical protein